MLSTYAAQVIATIRISFADRTNFISRRWEWR